MTLWHMWALIWIEIHFLEAHIFFSDILTCFQLRQTELFIHDPHINIWSRMFLISCQWSTLSLISVILHTLFSFFCVILTTIMESKISTWETGRQSSVAGRKKEFLTYPSLWFLTAVPCDVPQSPRVQLHTNVDWTPICTHFSCWSSCNKDSEWMLIMTCSTQIMMTSTDLHIICFFWALWLQ